jgi:hypothetical protein
LSLAHKLALISGKRKGSADVLTATANALNLDLDDVVAPQHDEPPLK